LLVVLFPAAGLGVAVGGLGVGWRRAHLLSHGEVVPATITGCQFGAGDDATFLAPSEYKNQTALLHGQVGNHPVLMLVSAFVAVWTLLATGLFIGGTIFCVVGLAALLFFFPGPIKEKALFVLAFSAFLVVWLVMGWFMVRSGWQSWWALRRRDTQPMPTKPVKCRFDFRVADGEVVQAEAPGQLSVTPGAETLQPALYDPARPRGALLLSGLWPDVRFAEGGGWETTGGAEGLFRLLVTSILLTSPLVVFLFLT
jgi:hypothetical protein